LFLFYRLLHTEILINSTTHTHTQYGKWKLKFAHLMYAPTRFVLC